MTNKSSDPYHKNFGLYLAWFSYFLENYCVLRGYVNLNNFSSGKYKICQFQWNISRFRYLVLHFLCIRVELLNSERQALLYEN